MNAVPGQEVVLPVLQLPRRFCHAADKSPEFHQGKHTGKGRGEMSARLIKMRFSSGDGNTRALGDAGLFSPRHVFTHL